MAEPKDKSVNQKIDGATAKPGGISDAELEKVAAGIEQVQTIGTSTSGAGAGKVTFNPFSITRG